jgi:hypothetical protein
VNWKSIRVYGPLAFLIATFIFMLVTNIADSDTGWVIITLALLAVVMLVAAQRLSGIASMPGRSLGGGMFHKSVSLAPDEEAIEELGAASTWPNRADRLVITSRRILTVDARTYFPSFGHKALSLEIAALRDVVLTKAKWYTAWFDRPRIWLVTDDRRYELWPAFGEDAENLEERVRSALVRRGWRPSAQAAPD